MPGKPPAAPAIGCRTHLMPGCGDARVIQCTTPDGHFRTIYAYRNDVRSDHAYHNSRAHPAVTTTDSGMLLDGSITGIVGDVRDTTKLNSFFLTFNEHFVYFDHDDTDEDSIHPADPEGATPVLSTGGLLGADCAAMPSAPPGAPLPPPMPPMQIRKISTEPTEIDEPSRTGRERFEGADADDTRLDGADRRDVLRLLTALPEGTLLRLVPDLDGALPPG